DGARADTRHVAHVHPDAVAAQQAGDRVIRDRPFAALDGNAGAGRGGRELVVIRGRHGEPHRDNVATGRWGSPYEPKPLAASRAEIQPAGTGSPGNASCQISAQAAPRPNFATHDVKYPMSRLGRFIRSSVRMSARSITRPAFNLKIIKSSQLNTAR